MITLKEIRFYDNYAGCEATWVDEDVQVKCHSYHPAQMDMLRADAEAFGTLLTDYEEQIADIELNYVPPAPAPIEVPQIITIRQAKLALLAAGLLDDVDAALAAAPRAWQIEWEYATEVHRSWPTLAAVQALVGLTGEQVDDLFIAAAAL